MLNAISLPPLRWRKKKGYIIPASFYTTNKTKPYKTQTESVAVAEDTPLKSQPPNEELAPQPQEELKEEISHNNEVKKEPIVNVPVEVEKSIPEAKQEKPEKGDVKVVSGFSISSIQLKKNANHQKAIEKEEENLPETRFTEADLLTYWQQLTTKKLDEGAQNLASILALEKPALEDHFVISYQVANSLNEVEMKQALPEILEFLRTKLNNFKLTIKLTISEHIREETLYSPEEKYNYLMEINPELKYLKDTFGLDL